MKWHLSRLAIAILLGCITTTTPAIASGKLEIWYLRHAETLSNSTHHHSHHNDTTFSGTGKRQVATITRKLDRMHFDHIIVSPKERAMMTVRPYLNKHGLKAEVWQELSECCWQKNRGDRKYRDGIRMIYRAAEKIRNRFAGSNQRILVVGHYHAGSRIAEVLQGREPNGRYKLRNTGMLHLIETDGGYFRLANND